MNRVFSIIKPKGITSHDVVYRVRKVLGIKKVGHTGTLDPDAIGVLPICVGRATKLSDLILNKDKSYEAELVLGMETDTYDISGKILNEVDKKEIEKLSIEEIRDAFYSQVGDILQMPPIYSALKVNGKKMYELARAGRESEIKAIPRKVHIEKINIEKIEGNKVTFKVDCSKGTYIRSICHDVGKILNVGATMLSLKRTKSGIFTLDKSITLEDLEEYKNSGKLEEHSYSVEDVLKEFPYLKLKDNAVKYYSNGGSIESRRFSGGDYSLFEENNYDEKYSMVKVYSSQGFMGVGKLKYEDGVLSVKNYKFFS